MSISSSKRKAMNLAQEFATEGPVLKASPVQGYETSVKYKCS